MAASLEYPPGFTVHNKPIQRSKLNHCVRLTKYLNLTACIFRNDDTLILILKIPFLVFCTTIYVHFVVVFGEFPSFHFNLAEYSKPGPVAPIYDNHRVDSCTHSPARFGVLHLLQTTFTPKPTRSYHLPTPLHPARKLDTGRLLGQRLEGYSAFHHRFRPSESQPTSPVHRTFSNPLPVDGLQLRQSAQPSSPSARAPHYTVRSRASMIDVYGFGQDVAWQEAHYEDPLPIGGPAHSADIRIIPPTPLSDLNHHDTTASATPLLRSPSAASTVSSQYSIASMPGRLPYIAVPVGSNDINVPPTPAPAVIHDALATDDRDWIDCTRSSVAPPHR
ncbi:hypothetical protein B0H11DRAFT_2362767 [Mycena galericulata]|nr:hypothetical protein B0H11DRAFT_2362767 [Mycena galericulata]